MTEAPPAAEQPTEAPAASAAPVVVQYWSNGWFPAAIDGRKAMVDKFNEEYKGKIQVDYIQGNWDDGEQYMQNGIAASGGIACVVEWYVDGALDWYRKEYVNDLRPYITPEIQGLMDDASMESPDCRRWRGGDERDSAWCTHVDPAVQPRVFESGRD